MRRIFKKLNKNLPGLKNDEIREKIEMKELEKD